MNKPKTHDNTTAQAFVRDYLSATELCEAHPKADDIFSGVLAAKTEGDTATRALSRKTLFRIVMLCPVISVDAVDAATHRRHAPSTLRAYAVSARLLSKALQALAGATEVRDTVLKGPRPLTIKQERELIDAPYEQLLQERLARAQPSAGGPPAVVKGDHDAVDPGRIRRLWSLAELTADSNC